MGVDIVWLFVYLLVAACVIPLVSFLGPFSIAEYRFEEFYDSQNAPFNIIYRILSPMLCCSIFMLLCVMVLDEIAIPVPEQRWLPTLFYWLLLIALKIGKGRASFVIFVSVVEALASVLLAIACDTFVIGGYTEVGLSVFDQSSLAFQMEVALFYVVVQTLVSLSVRRAYRCQKYSVVSGNSLDSSYSVRTVDVSEKKLFLYERKYGSLLSGRYGNDPLLRSVFFSIMAIEDSNRPPGFRLMERIAFPFGLSKTTGIMQQQSNRPLSDEESVQLAVGYVERMWDSYLVKYAKSLDSKNGESEVRFSGVWYEYDYRAVKSSLEHSFSMLYGDYCGSRLHNAGWVLSNVVCFEERNSYGFVPAKVVAQGSLCPTESSWLSSELAWWKDGQTIRGVSGRPSEYRCCYELTATGSTSSTDWASAATAYLKDKGYWVDSVMIAACAICRIKCYGKVDMETPAIDGCSIAKFSC